MDRSIAYFKEVKAKKYKYTLFELVRHIRALQRRTYGLTGHERTIIFDILTNSKMSYGNFRFLLYCVIPGTIIKEHEVKYILIWMFMNLRTNKRKCSAILIWICVMLHFNLCDKKAVKKFYPQFITMFKAGFQVQHVCKVIYDLTTPADIDRLMVQDFFLYWKKYPKNKPVGALLSRFKHYRADLVPENVPQVSPKSAFSFMLPHDLLHNINEIIGKDITELISYTKHFGKRKADEIIPPMLYLHFKHSIYKQSGRHRLYEFENAQEVAANHTFIELPHNILSLIADERGHLVLSCENIDTQIRLSRELEQYLHNVFFANDRKYYPEDKKQLLGAVINFLEFMQSPVPVVSKFLIKYIQIWDGTCYEKEVLHLITWLSFDTNKAYIKTFMPALESLFVTLPVEKKCSIVSAMGLFLINFVARSIAQRDNLFGGSVENFRPDEVVSNVASFILNLCAKEMYRKDDQYILHASLDFFELVCTISEAYDVPLQIPFPSSIAYRALFSKEATSLTRLCSIFLRVERLYKECDSLLVNNSANYMQGMFKDFYECLVSRKHLKGQNLIFNNNSQQTVSIKKLVMEERFTNISKHLAFSLLSLHYDDNILNEHDTARTAEAECKRMTDFLLNYQRVYVRQRKA